MKRKREPLANSPTARRKFRSRISSCSSGIDELISARMAMKRPATSANRVVRLTERNGSLDWVEPNEIRVLQSCCSRMCCGLLSRCCPD